MTSDKLIANTTPRDDECPICLEPHEKMTLLLCGHCFCKACLKELIRSNLNQNCPLCCMPIHHDGVLEICEEDTVTTSSFCCLC